MRDSRGFLWVCTRDGLSRFDGSRFVTYQVGDKNAPPGIEQILETRNGIYWIVTTGGLYRFDPNAPVPASKLNSDARPTLNAEFVSNERGLLFEDHAGQLWAGGSSFYRVNDSDKKVSFEPVDLNLPNPSLALGHRFHCRRKGWQPLVGDFLRTVASAVGWQGDLLRVPDPRANALTSVLVDHEGKVWLGRVLDLYALNPEPLSELSSLGKLTVRDLNQLARKQAPSSEGIQLPAKSGEIFEYAAAGFASSGGARFLYQTADTHIWISKGNSLVEFDGRFFKGHEGVGLQGPGQMAEDLSGNLWLGGANALVRLDRSGLISYANDLKDPYIVTINRPVPAPSTLLAAQCLSVCSTEKAFRQFGCVWRWMHECFGLQTLRTRTAEANGGSLPMRDSTASQPLTICNSLRDKSHSRFTIDAMASRALPCSTSSKTRIAICGSARGASAGLIWLAGVEGQKSFRCSPRPTVFPQNRSRRLLKTQWGSLGRIRRRRCGALY
jgi:hypothetical protein